MKHGIASKRTWVGVAAVACAVTLAFAIPAQAGDKGVKVGDKMPEFSMKDYTGKEHSLSDYEGKVLVLICSSHNCPWSRGADPHISKLAKEYSEKGVVFLGMDSDRTNEPEDIKTYAKDAGVPFPILKDEKNTFADVLGATRTPEVYIVDKDGTVVYHGAYDNRTSPADKGDVQYVANALDEVLAGQKISTPKVSAWGCTIKRVS